MFLLQEADIATAMEIAVLIFFSAAQVYNIFYFLFFHEAECNTEPHAMKTHLPSFPLSAPPPHPIHL